MTECKVSRVSQVGIIVSNLKQAIENFEKYLGISRWECFNGADLPPLEINGKPGKLNIKGAITVFPDRFEIELIEPTGDGPYLDYLKEHGPGVHHFAVMTPDGNSLFQDIVDVQMKEGKELWIHAKQIHAKDRRGMDFAYLDLVEEMGSIVEIYNEIRD